MSKLKALLDGLQKADDGLKPMIRYTAREDDLEAVKVFAQALTGDKAAVEKVQALVRSRNWGNWLGHMGRESTGQLIRKAAGENPCGKRGLTKRPRRCGASCSARIRSCSTSCSPGGW